MTEDRCQKSDDRGQTVKKVIGYYLLVTGLNKL